MYIYIYIYIYIHTFHGTPMMPPSQAPAAGLAYEPCATCGSLAHAGESGMRRCALNAIALSVLKACLQEASQGIALASTLLA